MGNNSNMNIQSQKEFSNRDEIDLRLIFNFLNRNKKILSLVSIVFIILGYISSFVPRRTWGGEFQIVLNSGSKSASMSSLSPIVQNIKGLSLSNNL